jgi:hypothetical protein
MLALVLLVTLAPGEASAGSNGSAPVAAVAASPTSAAAPSDTVNPFLPEDRAISDCVSAVPRPGCGSKARGGWHQYLVAVAMFGGVAIIGWRIVAGVRRR